MTRICLGLFAQRTNVNAMLILHHLKVLTTVRNACCLHDAKEHVMTLFNKKQNQKAIHSCDIVNYGIIIIKNDK